MRNVVAALLVAAFPLAAVAQVVVKPGALTAEVEVHVVNVDVSVMDAHGRPVTDLTKDDFEIFEDGKPQKVSNFAVIRSAGVPQAALAAQTGASAPQASTDRRRILLIVDNNYIGIAERNRALDTIEQYLGGSFDADWAVAAIGHTGDVVQSFTRDKTLVHAAIAKLRKLPSGEAQHQMNREVLSERFTRKNDSIEPYDFAAKMNFSSREQTFRNLMTMQNTARAVVDTARAYAAEDGKKFILFVTGGIEQNTTYSAFENTNDPEIRELRQQMAEVVDAMVKEANGANFTVHVINARGRTDAVPQHDVSNRSSGLVSANLLRDPGNEPVDISDPDSIPFQIAAGTGGMYLPSSDIHDSLAKIDALTSNFYSLGYSPEHNGDREYHTIKVKVKRAGVRVANRVGYFDETPEDRLEQMLRARMTFDDGFGSIPVKVEVGQAATADRELVLPVTGAMPISRITVIPGDQGFVGRIHLYCSVFDEHGNNIGFSHQVKKVTMSADEVSSEGDFRITMKVHLKPGAFTIVVTLRDELSNELGSASEVVHL